MSWITPSYLSESNNADDKKNPPVVKVLGVCGGIGSGKSAACQMLVSDLDCMLHIDSDSLAHTVYAPNSRANQEIADEFGSDLVDAEGEMDRKKLGSIVFADQTAMQRLEKIVWPHVQTKIRLEIERAKSAFETTTEEQQAEKPDGSEYRTKRPVIVVEAAVLLDAGWQDFLDGVWVVSVERDVAVQRLQEMRGLAKDEADKRIEAQQSRRGIGNLQQEVQNNVVSAVIDNCGTLDDLRTSLAEKLNDPTAWYQKEEQSFALLE